MALHRTELAAVARVVTRSLIESTVAWKVGEHEVQALIESALNRLLDDEAALETEAEAIFRQKGRQIAGIDPAKAVELIKKQLAKQKRFPL